MLDDFKTLNHKGKCGCYLLLNKGKVTYIGSSTNIEARISHHPEKYEEVRFIEIDETKDIKLYEAALICHFNPPNNRSLPVKSETDEYGQQWLYSLIRDKYFQPITLLEEINQNKDELKAPLPWNSVYVKCDICWNRINGEDKLCSECREMTEKQKEWLEIYRSIRSTKGKISPTTIQESKSGSIIKITYWDYDNKFVAESISGDTMLEETDLAYLIDQVNYFEWKLTSIKTRSENKIRVL